MIMCGCCACRQWGFKREAALSPYDRKQLKQKLTLKHNGVSIWPWSNLLHTHICAHSYTRKHTHTYTRKHTCTFTHTRRHKFTCTCALTPAHAHTPVLRDLHCGWKYSVWSRIYPYLNQALSFPWPSLSHATTFLLSMLITEVMSFARFLILISL